MSGFVFDPDGVCECGHVAPWHTRHGTSVVCEVLIDGKVCRCDRYERWADFHTWRPHTLPRKPGPVPPRFKMEVPT